MPIQSILIIADNNDVHAQAVRYALCARGCKAEILAPASLPLDVAFTMHISPDGHGYSVCSSRPSVGPPSDLRSFEAIWLRHPRVSLLPENMHAGDKMIAQRQCDALWNGLIGVISHRSTQFWVNHPTAEAKVSNKPLQLIVAEECGFLVPDSYFGTDPAEIRRFLEEHGNRVAYKLLQPANWISDDHKQIYGVYTTTLSTRDLPNDRTLRLCPSILQAYIDKSYEVRVACMGKTLMAVKIDSQSDRRASIDWRAGQDYVGMTQVTIPDSVARKIFTFMEYFGLAFACLDFIVDKDGRYIFLEANQQGQFLWMEVRAGLPILAAFSDYLISADPHFSWVPNSHPITFEQASQAFTPVRTLPRKLGAMAAPDQDLPA